jgi:hypothetical protein
MKRKRRQAWPSEQTEPITMFPDHIPLIELKLLQDAYGAVFIKRKSRVIQLTPAETPFRPDVKSILERVNRQRKKYAGGASYSREKSER